MSDSDVATLMTCRLAREVADGDVVGVGLGTPLALTAALLARRTHAPDAELLVAGALSPDADVATCLGGADALSGRTPAFVPHLLTMEQAERGAMTMQFLRPAEVDGQGNANTSRILDGGRLLRRLPGGLATADVLRVLPRVVLYHTDHRPRSLPARVGFVGGAGGGSPTGGTRGPVRLITNRAVFAFTPAGPVLESVHAGEEPAAVLAETGFEAESGGVGETEAPRAAELEALAHLDAHALRELELRATRKAAAARLAALSR